MAQKKRTAARIQRRAEKIAAIKAQEDAEARERKQQTRIGMIFVSLIAVIVIVIAGVVYYNYRQTQEANSVTVEQAYQQLQQASPKPSRATSQGGLVMSKNGWNKKIANVPTMEIYMDPLCPGCGGFHRQMDDTIAQLLNAGQINIVFYPMAFMDSLSTDQYSSRAVTGIYYIASHDNNPVHTLNFIRNIYSESFQPDEGSGYQSVSDEALIEQAQNAGVSASVAKAAFKLRYTSWLNALSNYTPKRSELWNISGQAAGSMTTPTIRINDGFFDYYKVASTNLDMKTTILNTLGISANDVGNPSVLPTAGSTKKPSNNF
ncbi:MAG: thioredoxin domain-containing protein [Bifidobacteriaceae bacterium]|nr:thioredoxin domain-containing protein [Bifidobacteriaceae bacterium]